jgi:hypothetical protein
MTAQLVTLIIDRTDGAENPYTQGSGVWIPSSEIPDPADHILIGQDPIPFMFSAGAFPSVQLVANDTAGPQQSSGAPGWSWIVKYGSNVPGNPPSASYYILSTNGLTQRLSQLVPIPLIQPGIEYVSAVNSKTGAVVLSAADVGALANPSPAGGALSGSYPNPGFGSGVMGGYLAPKVKTLVDGASVPVDLSQANLFRWLLNSPGHSLANPSNLVDGLAFVVRIIYGGPYTPLFGTAYEFGSDGQPTWSASAGKIDEVGFAYNADAGAGSGSLTCRGWKLGYT